jgi:hypothetical protein
MSLSRQKVPIPDKAQAPVVGAGSHWPSRSEKAEHAHFRHQLMYSQEGVIHVTTPARAWILPPTKSILGRAPGHFAEPIIREILSLPLFDGLQNEAGDEFGLVAIGVIG